jgi:hypothetical protein
MFTCPECDRPINQASEVCPYCDAELLAARGAAAGPARNKQALGKVLAASLVLVAGLWAVLWYVLPRRPGNSPAQAETSAVESLRALGAALGSYARNEGGYPASLEQLGEAALRPAQQAQANGYRLVYSPGPFEPDGNIRTYTLVAQPGFYGYRSFYLDQTGVVRATRKNRPATAHDQPL